jgi:hypothetical protein
MDIELLLESCLVLETSYNALFKSGEFFEKFPINPFVEITCPFFWSPLGGIPLKKNH